ncbi:DUF6049 family protein, partial [Streptomyces sp. B1866]|uniref:DUF6049 family protein n=1 Tax=Streptomyces sp. B1866 TaxID=3075431 RepID=UPI00288E3EA9
GAAARPGPLPPGARRAFRLAVPVADLGLDGPGAYALTVAATARDGSVLALDRTFLPAASASAGASADGGASRPEPLRATVVWPVTAAPRMEALGLRTAHGVRPVFRDDGLADEFAPGGRLWQVVAAGAGSPVTWVVDPDLIVQARAMADGYQVARTPDSSNPRDSAPGRGGQAAARWLAALRDAVRGREVVTLPYADPDLASLAHRPGGGELAGIVRGTTASAARVVDRALGTRARRGLAWPWAGALDTRVTAYAGRLGLGAVLAAGP